jgi:hypothetical protein
MKNQTIQKFNTRAVEDLTHYMASTLQRFNAFNAFNAPTASDLSSLVKPGKAW